MTEIGVECTFDEQGKVQVRRIRLGDRWQTAEQGRQWLAEDGRHVLVLLNGTRSVEIILLRDSMAWVIKGSGSPGAHVV